MSEKPDGSKGDHDDPLAGPTYVIGTIGVVLLVSITILLQAVVYDSRDAAQAEADGATYFEIGHVRAAQRADLESYGWTYPEEDRVRIPIGWGVERVLERYGAGAKR